MSSVCHAAASPHVHGHAHAECGVRILMGPADALTTSFPKHSCYSTCPFFPLWKSSVVFSSECLHPQIIQSLSTPSIYSEHSQLFSDITSPLVGDQGTTEKWNIHRRRLWYLLELLTGRKCHWFVFSLLLFPLHSCC